MPARASSPDLDNRSSAVFIGDSPEANISETVDPMMSSSPSSPYGAQWLGYRRPASSAGGHVIEVIGNESLARPGDDNAGAAGRELMGSIPTRVLSAQAHQGRFDGGISDVTATDEELRPVTMPRQDPDGRGGDIVLEQSNGEHFDSAEQVFRYDAGAEAGVLDRQLEPDAVAMALGGLRGEAGSRVSSRKSAFRSSQSVESGQGLETKSRNGSAFVINMTAVGDVKVPPGLDGGSNL